MDPEKVAATQADQTADTQDEFFNATTGQGMGAHAENQRLNFSNLKRTYDLHQTLDTMALIQGQLGTSPVHGIMVQALQNAVENANLAAKSYLEHNNLAHDSYWNPVSAGTGMNLTAGAVPANRATDVASAGVASTIPASVTSAIEQLMQVLATATTSIANVLNQVQPKTPSATS